MIVANALKLPYSDKIAHMVATSPPYAYKRRYQGVESLEWPAVTYRPMPGLPAVEVPAVRWRPRLRLKPMNGGLPGRCDRPPAAVWLDDTPDAGILGLEPDPLAYIGHLVLIFRECWRVLRDDGVLAVNIGDTYYSTSSGTGGTKSREYETASHPVQEPIRCDAAGYKPKDLMGIPWRLAFALIADGWTLRSRMPGGVEADLVPEEVALRPDIVWAKNAMPESVRDRPSVDFEDVFIFSKSRRYFFDQENGRVPLSQTPAAKWWRENFDPKKQTGELHLKETGMKSGNDGARTPNPAGANMRASWKINTEPTSEAHYAAFPRELVRRLIRIGTSDKGCCPECGASWRRVVGRQRTLDGEPVDFKEGKAENRPGVNCWSDGRDHRVGAQGVGHWRFGTKTKDLGWQPSCSCRPVDGELVVGPYSPVPCTVLDPFSGIGRTGEVCAEEGRRYLGNDLSVGYAAIQRRRLADARPAAEAMLEKRRAAAAGQVLGAGKAAPIEGPLFEGLER